MTCRFTPGTLYAEFLYISQATNLFKNQELLISFLSIHENVDNICVV